MKKFLLVGCLFASSVFAGEKAECDRVWKNNPNDKDGFFYRLCLKPAAKIGMSTEQVRYGTEWGEPSRVNRTVTSTGSKEQWVYLTGEYLYFTNGKLTAIQFSK